LPACPSHGRGAVVAHDQRSVLRDYLPSSAALERNPV
jgi:hypothetical protein